jgi:hypothetical protein
MVQIDCNQRNPAGRLTLSPVLRVASSTTFVAFSLFPDLNSNSYGGTYAGVGTASSGYQPV